MVYSSCLNISRNRKVHCSMARLYILFINLISYCYPVCIQRHTHMYLRAIYMIGLHQKVEVEQVWGCSSRGWTPQFLPCHFFFSTARRAVSPSYFTTRLHLIYWIKAAKEVQIISILKTRLSSELYFKNLTVLLRQS